MKLYDSRPEAVNLLHWKETTVPANFCHRFFLELKALEPFLAGTHYGYLANPQQPPTLPAKYIISCEMMATCCNQ